MKAPGRKASKSPSPATTQRKPSSPQRAVLEEVAQYLKGDFSRRIVALDLYPSVHYKTGRRDNYAKKRKVLHNLVKAGYLSLHPDLPPGCRGWYLVTDNFTQQYLVTAPLG